MRNSKVKIFLIREKKISNESILAGLKIVSYKSKVEKTNGKSFTENLGNFREKKM